MYFQIIIHSQYFNVIRILKTPLFTCENDPLNSLDFSKLVWERYLQWEILSVKRTTGLKSQLAFSETVPQIEK